MKSERAPWAIPFEEVVSALGVDPVAGLDLSEAERRLQQDGSNTLQEEKRRSPWRRFADQFKSPIVLILLLATILSVLLGEWVDGFAIFAIVLINAIVAHLQESKTEAAIESLRKLSAPLARVIRGGEGARAVPSSQVCRGDILVLEAGDYVPADARLVEAFQLGADESILTGESLPVEKSIAPLPPETALADRRNMLFGGTVIATGSGRAVVTATGMGTELGRIAGLLQKAETASTPLQTRLGQLSRRLLYLAGGVVVLIGGMGLVRGESTATVAMTAISLAVAAIPEGLGTVVMLALVLAVGRMARRNAIVRHLPAVETLGSTDVICTDKTGTLTSGQMRVREVLLSDGVYEAADSDIRLKPDFDRLARAATLCSNASLGRSSDEGAGDPTEVALLIFARNQGLNLQALRMENPRVREWSFESLRKRMSVLVGEDQSAAIYMKGAPEAVLPLCRPAPGGLDRLTRTMDDYLRQGRRLLAVAWRPLAASETAPVRVEEAERDLHFLGVFSLADPPRIESSEAIRECQKAGIRVVMITGDHPVTAQAIALELGILSEASDKSVLTGPELDQVLSASPQEFTRQVEKTAVYARVSPEHKLAIVRAWKQLGKTVAMTGDGVNDAPALKEASIGIAMGRGGTEVARQASSMVLTDDHFATIVSAVREGRAVYGNIRRTIQYLLSGNLAEVLLMVTAVAIGWPAPLAPIHLLWINLVTDGLPALALAAEPVSDRVLEEMGRPSPGSFFDRRFIREMIFVSIVTMLLTLAVYGLTYYEEGAAEARSRAFFFLVLAELFRSFACRSERLTFFQLGAGSNLYHLGAVGIPIAIQLLLHSTPFFQDIFKVGPIEWSTALVLAALTLIPVTLLEIRKIIRPISA